MAAVGRLLTCRRVRRTRSELHGFLLPAVRTLCQHNALFLRCDIGPERLLHVTGMALQERAREQLGFTINFSCVSGCG